MSKGKEQIRYKRLKIFAIVMAIIITVMTVVALIFVDNKSMDYDYYELKNEKMGSSGIKVTHLSDLHFPKIKVDVDELVGRIAEERPNLIAITGDLIDESANIGSSGVTAFLDKIMTIADIYYVFGNHENRGDSKVELAALFEQKSIIVLENESVNVNISGTEVTIIGLGDDAEYSKDRIKGDTIKADNYKILLAHRPEKWYNYIEQESDYLPDLVLAGHAHGGQFRVFGQGIIAPNQGIFPKYDSGRYDNNNGNTTMIVSRGMGNSIIAFRFNNKPHMPIITIKN